MPQYDAIVIGGGPAGSAAAHLLARWGHRVVLIHRPARPGSELAESLPPSCRRLIGRLGLLEAVDSAGFMPTRGNTVWWGADEGRSEPFPDGASGYQVRRSDLERVLLAAAEASGVRVHRSCTARGVSLDGSAVVECESRGGGRRVLRAPFVLDCSGRAGVIATQGFRRGARRQRTIAMVGVWRREAGWGLADEGHTLVEAYGDGWAWSVPVSATERYVTVMVSPGVTDLARGARLAAAYDAELRKTRHLAALVARAAPVGSIWSCDASLYGAERFAGPGFLLVGDAGSFIEPLSSFGVKKALASAWAAAIVVRTCLTKPVMRDAALDFYTARERRVYASYRRQSALYFEQALQAHAHPFWSDRFTDADLEAGVGTGGAVDVVALREDPEVQAAFRALKAAPRLRLRPAARLRCARFPAIEEREVVLEERIVDPRLPGAAEGLRFLRGVDLPALVGMAAAHAQVPDLFESYNRAHAPVILPDFLGALSVLVATGCLESMPEPRGRS